VLKDNQNIPKDSKHLLPDTCFEIKTSGDPVFIEQYGVPLAHIKDVDEAVEQWMKNDIVTHAPWNSPWNSPILPAPPKTEGGSCRVCFDGRGINNVTVDNPGNIIPKIKDIQENLGNFKWITTLDWKNIISSSP